MATEGSDYTDGHEHGKAKILLATINARYTHTAFGLRWLWANLGELKHQARILEFHLGQPALQIAETILAHSPRLLGLGVYIWNVELITDVARIIKTIRPEILIVLGGPEISYEYEATEIFALADYLIRGEGEMAFASLARQILADELPSQKVIEPAPPDLSTLASPYAAYTDDDLARRRLFVEASRGCPFRCEFCLSSLDPTVREFPLDPFLADMGLLIERGAREFVFVDRTFNLRPARVQATLEFFLSHWRDGMNLHFEIVPDRLDGALLDAIVRFPAGGLHLEVGLQSLNPEVQEAISRRQDIEKTLDNLRFLREKTGAWIHADLIVGLPGESLDSFASGFDHLVEVRPQQIQVGILKRLKGAPIARHAAGHAMVYSAQPPYEILQNDRIDFFLMQRLKRLARYFELYYNSGNFPESLPLLFASRPSAFDAFLAFSDHLWRSTGRTHEFALPVLARYLFDFLSHSMAPQTAAAAIDRDYRRLPGRREKLEFLK